MDDKYETLKQERWSDTYFCKLALLDHLRECLEKDKYLKAIDESKDSEKYKALDKELMDLKIILTLYFDDSESLESERLDTFIRNAKR